MRYTNNIMVANSFKHFEFRLPLIVASRKKLQAALFERLKQEQSVQLHLGKRLKFDRDWALFNRINIVATGITGFSKKALGKELQGVGKFQYQLIPDNGQLDDLDSLIFFMLPKAKGYAWLFAAPDGIADIGIGGLSKTYDWNKGLQNFNNWLRKKLDIKLQLQKRNRSWGIPIPIDKPGRIARRVKNKLFIGVGDAIELPDPLTAAGIEGAWYSGELVADAIQSGSQIDVQQYATTLQQMMLDNNLTGLGQRMITRLARNRVMFPLIMSLIPGFLVKRLLKDPTVS